MTAVTATAHAGVTLRLSVGDGPADPGLRPFDAVRMAVTPVTRVTLDDDRDVARVSARRDDGRGAVTALTVRGHRARPVPCGPDNLAWRATEAAIAAAGAGARLTGGVRLHVDKGFPGGSGLGSAAADAAAALVAARAKLGLALTDGDLRAIAADLGPAVVAALDGGATVITSDGAEAAVAPVLARGPFHWVMALHTQPLSAAEVLRARDRIAADRGIEPAGDPNPLLRALAAGDAEALAASMRNEVQPAVISLKPGLRRIFAAGEEAGALASTVSSTGTAVAFLCPDRATALEVAVAAGGVGLTLEVIVAEGAAGAATLLPPPEPAA
ncbi:GHMP family kinase ATP-binding protein [Corynebacterium sp. 335C]